MKKHLVVLSSNEGYEALYFNDFKVEEGNPLEEGSERFFYFLNKCDAYGVEYRDVHFYDIDSDNLPYGELPDRFSSVNGRIKWEN